MTDTILIVFEISVYMYMYYSKA